MTLEDGELLLEVELTANLIVAASESDGPLSQQQIDAILGVGASGQDDESSETAG
ncbi:hypothetical protein [Nocardioides alcanivorans]|uniref:hypothetical protein n=1 Tax=Nocardioides alcanivorans TaxID=2897352 RepID=UPI001F47B907|nr:hypothetical protein [Nocardioides alcanivorans]